MNALKTDLYELTMAAGYFYQNMNRTAAFSLFSHSLPQNRPFILTAGQQQIAEFILEMRFSNEDIQYLRSVPALKDVGDEFFDYLKDFRFSGDIRAVPEGTVVFGDEPILEVTAPIIEAQILETFALAAVNINSLVATKGARIVHAANLDGKKRKVVDFGSRRAHGPEAGLLSARAGYLAGCDGTSDVMAGRRYNIPVFGTVAHSWVTCFKEEIEAFKAYHEIFPGHTILLIDTYDTIEAAKQITRLSYRGKIKSVRIDSGDLPALSREVRRIFDEAGLGEIKIILSGGLDEYKITQLIRDGAPVDAFGVGTALVTSKDYPALDLAYKLVEFHDEEGRPMYVQKFSPGKTTKPGRKQIFRFLGNDGRIVKDVLGLFDEPCPAGARPLLQPLVNNGRPAEGLRSLEEMREYAAGQLAVLPDGTLDAEPKGPAPKPEISPRLQSVMKKGGCE
ncbi:MAG: nicotinate phosphoribosyltransferase [Candidatus Omnitrophota bacterium]